MLSSSSVPSIAGILLGLIPPALAIVTWAWKVMNWVWLKPMKFERLLRQQGISGNRYRFLFGDLKVSSLMLRNANSRPIGLSDDIAPRLLPFLHQSLGTHGKNFFMWIGTTPALNIMHPEQLKDVFLRIDDFQKIRLNPLAKMLTTGLAHYDGDKWEMHRRIINPAFQLGKLKLMLPAFYSSCNEMVMRWEKLMGAEESCELDAWTDIQNLTRQVIAQTAFGSSYEEGKVIFQLQTEQGELAVKSMHMVYIPGWRFLPTKMNRRMKSIYEQVQSLLRTMIDKREKAMEAGKAATDDLLGLLLESNAKEIRENRRRGDRKVGMSMGDVIEECKLFYLVGQETTSSLLAWAMVLLSIHPQWQDCARLEVLQVLGRDRLPSFDELNHLKIVTMILYEVLRLYPPVPLFARDVPNETKLGELTIPAGVKLLMPALLIHHDRELWGEDAKEFKPERFCDGISKATKNQLLYFPFGWGPRICLGQNLSLIEVKIAMAMILQRFSFELSPSYAHAPMSAFTLQPQHGVQVILRRSSV
ncbi:cytochrome P450 CYP72A219-like [Punica granatum]|uniref:Cytochrome P450 CYP72A219-like n=1 Tax=Punica granatum TaxID=22663 RepID=A0A6P8E9Q6_PUNGR|nr:cytochrome P450 CYP72A219-like [Punica granatum]